MWRPMGFLALQSVMASPCAALFLHQYSKIFYCTVYIASVTVYADFVNLVLMLLIY